MKSKKKIIITSIGIVFLLVALIGASYAYFAATIGSGSTTPVTVEAGTIDSLVFNTGNPITLEANQDNFASGQGNRSGSTTASAILTANNQASSAVTYNYNVYLNIEENTYTKTGSSAELVLRVTDPNTGNLVSIPDLTQVTVGGVTGYDITEETGLITLASNYSISTQSTKTDTWNIYVYFVNLSSDQSDNAGAYFEGNIQITQGNYVVQSAITDNCITGQALNSCITSTYKSDGTDGLYYHSVGKTTSAEDGSYRYAGDYDEVNNYVCFGTTSETCDYDHLYRIIGVITTTLSDGTTTQNLVKLIKSDYTKGIMTGTNGDYNGNVTNDQHINSSSFPNYHGSISSIETYYWNHGQSSTERATRGSTIIYNQWRSPHLNKTNLNNYYLNTYLGNTWNSKIAEVQWIVAGNDYNVLRGQNAKTIYTNEIVSPVPGTYGSGLTTFSGKVALVYLSDYAYANSNWTILSDSYDIGVSNNWMYNGIEEWTITRANNGTESAFRIKSTGNINTQSVRSFTAIRPVFYLTNGTTYQSGSGTYSDPIRIN